MSEEPQSATSGKKVKSLLGKAAKLAQKQAALTKINSVSLPKVYHAIGRRIVAIKNLPTDLVPFRDKIKQLDATMATQPEPPKADETGFAAKAKQIAARASKAAGDAAAVVKLQAAYVSLGKQAVEKYGEKAIPKELVEEYRSLIAQHEVLGIEVESLASAPGQGVITPKRLAIAGAVVCLILGVSVVRFTASWLFGGRAGLRRDVSDEVVRATSNISRGLDSIGEKLERDKARMESESRNRKVQEREVALQRRERELEGRERHAQEEAARKAAASQTGIGRGSVVESPPVAEISNLREGRPLLLVDNAGFVYLANNDYRNLLVFPSRDFPENAGSLMAKEPGAPKSLKDAIEAYKKAVVALQKCPVLASLQINKAIGKNRFLANWQGQTCVFESNGTAFELGRGHYIPVTCKHVVSYAYEDRNCSDHPYLVQAGEESSDEVATRNKYADDLKDELDDVLRAGQWIVYFGIVDLPSDSSRLTELDITKMVSLGENLPRAKELIDAVRQVATDTMTRDAPALCYALRCANRSMVEDAIRRKHFTDTQIESNSDRMVLPAASSLQWAIWFRNPGPKEEQVGILECLKACGANWDEQDDEGRTPLMHAMLAEQQHAIAYLCENGLGVTKPDAEGRTPLMRALVAWDDKYKPVMSLPNAVKGVDRNGDNVLHYCDRYQFISVLPTMKTLVEQGASITEANKAGDTPLHVLARVAARGRGEDYDNAKPWTEAIRFFLAKGGDGAANNASGETPIGMLTQSHKVRLTGGFLFPSEVAFDAKEQQAQRHRAMVLQDKTVLWVSDKGNRRTTLIKRSLDGKTLAQQTIEGELLQTSHLDNFNVCEIPKGGVFCCVKRGNGVYVVALNETLEPRWESAPAREFECLAVQPDGSLIVMCCKRIQDPHFLRKIDSSGKEEWASKEDGPLRRSDESLNRNGGHWATAPNGVFAILASRSASDPYSVVSMSGDGVEMVRAQPFLEKRSGLRLTGVLADGTILVQSPHDENEAVLIGKGGKVRWRHPIGVCTGICELRSGGLAVASRSGTETRLTSIDKAGKVEWEVALESKAGRFARCVQEGVDGKVFVFSSEGHTLWTVSREGKILALAEYPFYYGTAEPPRVFEDGMIVWPDERGNFMYGDYLKWPK